MTWKITIEPGADPVFTNDSLTVQLTARNFPEAVIEEVDQEEKEDWLPKNVTIDGELFERAIREAIKHPEKLQLYTPREIGEKK